MPAYADIVAAERRRGEESGESRTQRLRAGGAPEQE